MNSSVQHASGEQEFFPITVSQEDLQYEVVQNKTTDPLVHSSILVTCSALLLINTVLGIPANTMICAAVVMSKTLRTSMNALIVNLSIADLINCSVCSTLMMVASIGYVTQDSIPKSLCHTLDSFHVLGGSAQLITLGSISLERYQALYKPFEKKYVVTRVKISLATSWTVGMICMITAWTFFQDSPTLLLCDRFDAEHAHNHLSYKLGIYIFVPLTFLSVLIILVFYGRILYLIQKHVKSTEKTLGGGKKIKKNKVGPEKDYKTSVVKVMVNNFMPPGFSIIDNDLRGSRTSLASIGKEENNSDKGNTISPLAAYTDSETKIEMLPKGTNSSAEKRSGKSKRISSISQNVDVLPTLHSVSSLSKSLSKSSANELIEIPMKDDKDVNNVMDDDANNKRLSTSRLKMTTLNTTASNNTQQTDCKQSNANTSANDGGFCELEDQMQQFTTYSPQGDNTLLPDKVSQLNKAEAAQCSEEVITNLSATSRHPSNSVTEHDCEYHEPEDTTSNQLIVCADNQESITGIDALPLEIKRNINKSLAVPGEDRTGIRSKYDTNETNFRLDSSEPESHLKVNHFEGGPNLEPGNQIRASVNAKEDVNQALVGTNKIEVNTSVTVQSSGYGTEETEITELQNNSAEVEAKKAQSVKKDRNLTMKMSVVKIYDADGLTVKAKTSRETVAGDICVINTSNKIKGKRKLEAKSAKRTAIVLVTFLIAWLPFPIIIVVSWYLHNRSFNQIQALISAYVVSMTLSLLAASVNPLVYGAINKQFYKEFKKMYKKSKQSCTKKLKRQQGT